MGKGKTAEKIIVLLLLLALGFAGGTARLRPAASATRATPAATSAPTQPSAPPATDTPAPTATEAPAQSAAETPAPAAETPEPTPAPEAYTLSFVGDCTFGSVPGIAGGYLSVVDGDYAYPFAKTVQYFLDDDFTMANLECCLTDETVARVKTFVFRAPPSYAQILTEGSVEFVTLANNHVLDYGQKGYDDTRAAAEAAGAKCVGRDEWAVYETDRGLKIGVYGVSFGTVAQIKAGIAALKEAGAEFIIAALHWGDEGSYQVNADQKTQAHAAIDAGADFVYGSHPHTLQPMEVYQDKLIVYCMGNWSFGGNTNPRDKDTFILQMTVLRAFDGTTQVEDYTVVPCASSGEVSRNNYQPAPYAESDEGYQRVLDKLGGDFHGSNLSIGYGYSANE